MKSVKLTKKITIVSCTVLLGVALSGCNASTPSTQEEQPVVEEQQLTKDLPVAEETQPVEEQQPVDATDTEAYIGEEEAKSIALTHAEKSEADVSHMLCKLDYDDGVAEYKVEFWDGTTEYDYEINAVSGEIIGFDYDMESYDVKPETATEASPDANASAEYIGEEEAKEIAFTHAGVTESEASYVKCEFDFDDGIAEYEVEWEIGRTEYEYTISATDGTVWEHDVDYDD